MAMTQPLSSSFSFSRRPPPSSASPGTGAPPRLASSSANPSSWSPPRHRARRRALTAAVSLHLGPEEIAELARNKALIAATVACSVGQLVKLFTSGKNGCGVDIRAAVRSGGMPSTHSAAVVAGVRREVGKHAGLLNKQLTLREKMAQNSEDDGLVNSTSELISVSDKAASSFQSNVTTTSRHSSRTKPLRLNAHRSSEPELTELTELKHAYEEEYTRLSESVGHTELQVAVGALLGFVVSLAVYATL